MLNLKKFFETYSSFVNRLFKERKKFVDNDTIKYVYELFRGHTFYVQKVFNEAFSMTENGKTCNIDIAKTATNNILGEKETTYMEILSAIPEKQKSLLYAIADEGMASHITSMAFVKKHNLESASSVQSAVKQLLGQNLITEIHKEFSVTDKFFALWINRIYNEK